MLHLATLEGDLLAFTTPDHPLSRYNYPVWSVQTENPPPGPVILTSPAPPLSLQLELLGIVDGWAILRDEGGAALGVIWSDGDYAAGLIRRRETGEIALDVTLEAIATGEYQVEGTTLFPGNLLGCSL